MMDRRIDTEQIKAGVDLRELASRYVDFQRPDSDEPCGPCPKCGGTDRFHCKATWFFCRQCHAERGDAIEFLRWLHGCSFVDACVLLGEMRDLPPAKLAQVPEIKSERRWETEKWRTKATREVEEAARRLNNPSGQQGRQYLESRGIEPLAWKAWRLGYVPNVEKWFQRDGAWKAESLGTAITLPWYGNHKVKAIQYRFLDQAEMRYWQKPGGDRTLFGLNMLAGRSILVVCEGELNAVSIWQAAHDLVDVVSFGSESNLEHAANDLRLLVQRYSHVIVWTDKPERALASLRIVGADAKPLQSPNGLDANDVLQKGVLRGFIERLLSKFDIQTAEKQGEAFMPDSQMMWYPIVEATSRELSSRLQALLGKPLLGDRIAELCMLADAEGVRLQWQRYDLNDPTAGWRNVH